MNPLFGGSAIGGSTVYICMYVCVTLRNAINCVLRMAWPALLWLSSHMLLPSVLAEVESRMTTERRVGKGLGILLHYAKESNERNTKLKLIECGVTRPEVRTLNNWCSFSLEKQKSPPREFAFGEGCATLLRSSNSSNSHSPS